MTNSTVVVTPLRTGCGQHELQVEKLWLSRRKAVQVQTERSALQHFSRVELRQHYLCSRSGVVMNVDGFTSPSITINRSHGLEPFATVSVEQLSVHTDSSHHEILKRETS